MQTVNATKPCKIPSPWLSVTTLSGVMLLLWLIGYWQGDTVFTALALTPERVSHGAVWQLLSAHTVHFTFSHVAMNIAVFVMATYAIAPKFTNAQLVYSLGVMSVALGVLLWVFNPEYSPYAGFSGVLHGYVVLALCRTTVLTGAVRNFALLCIAVKIGYEQSPFFSPSDFQQGIGAEVAVDAHLYGALLGLLATLGFALHHRYTLARTA